MATPRHCGFTRASVPSPEAVIRGVLCCLVSEEGRVQLCSRPRPGARTQPRGRGKPETGRRLGPALGILYGSHGWDLLRTVCLASHETARTLCLPEI